MEMAGGGGGGGGCGVFGVRQVCVQPVVRLMGGTQSRRLPLPRKKPLVAL